MKKLIVSALMLVAVHSAMAADAEAGKAKAAVCSACHGADGNSVVPDFPKLAGQHATYILKQLKDMTVKPAEGGRAVPQMTGIVAGLSEEDMANLAAYYSKQTMQGGAAKADLVEKGESVYRAGNQETGVAACSGCHGPDGKGNNGATYPRLAGQHAAYIEKQLKAFRLGAEEPKAQGARVNDGDSAIMRQVAAHMSDLEIRAVASFIAGLR